MAILQSNKYRKARKRWRTLPEFAEKPEALEALALLQWSNALRKIELSGAVPASEPWYRKNVSRYRGESTRWDPLQEGDYFVWVNPEPPASAHGLHFIILHVLLLSLILWFRSSLTALPWKIYIRHRDDYSNLRLALTASNLFDFVILLLLAPFLIVSIRAVVFAATHLYCGRGLWIFPNLLIDETFLGPFFPIYAWDENPKESICLKWRRFKNSILGELGMSKRRRGRGKFRASKGQGK